MSHGTNEPKVLFLGGNRGRWNWSERASDAATMNSGEAWVFVFNGDFIQNIRTTPVDIKDYDIVIANSDSFAIEHLYKLSQQRPASTKWVTIVEGDALDYLKPRPFVRELFDSSDLVNVINCHTTDFFRKVTSAKVEYIGFPYPAREIRSLSTPFQERERKIFLGPMLLSRWIEYYCVKDLDVPFYGYEKRLSRKLHTIWKQLRTHRTLDPWHFHKKVRNLYNDSSFHIHREEPLSEFFRRNGAAYLWLNLDQRYTWGRYVLDAAALQVPIITTRSTGHGDHFFPLTTIDNEFEVEKTIMLIERLLNDNDFYREVATVPIESFDHLRPEIKKQELLKALFPAA